MDKEELVNESINYLRVINDVYGAEKSILLFENLSNVFDPELKKLVTLALLTGQYGNKITLVSVDNTTNKVAMIKLIREITGSSLKEAKDIADAVFSNTRQTIECDFRTRSEFVRRFKEYGVRTV